MTLRNFQIFVEVCRQGTMSAAAQKLYISQSAISQVIKDLENHYHTTLFHRVSHKLYLTEAGKKLYNHALHMVLYNEQIESVMTVNPEQANLRIGSISAFMMIDLLKEYKSIHPNVTFSMFHQTRANLDLLLQSSQIDIAIVSGLFNITNYDFYPLTTIPLVFICAVNSHLSPLLEVDEPVLTLEQLSEFPIYLCAMSEDLTHQLNTLFSSQGLRYNISGQFLYFGGVNHAVFSDSGIGLINETTYLKNQKYFKKITIKDVHLESSIFLACHKQNSENTEINSFIHFAQERFENLKQAVANQSAESYQWSDFL